MITKLAISNYRSIGELGVQIELKPLTILLGSNGSGKSSIMEALCMLMQREKATFLGSLRDGELVSYPTVNSIAHKGKLDRLITIEINMTLSDSESNQIKQLVSAIDTVSLKIKIDKLQPIGYRVSYKPETEETYQSILIGYNEIIKSGYIRTGEHSYQNRVVFPQIAEAGALGDVQTMLNDSIFKPESRQKVVSPLIELANLAHKIIKSKLNGNLFTISAFRGDVKLEGQADALPHWVGKNGQNLLELLALIFGNRRYRGIQEKVGYWAERFEIFRLNAGWRGKSVVGADYLDSTFKTPLELALAGYGSRQILSIITQLFWSKAGDIIMVEEPEISLHPNSQALLPELFADAVKEGKQVIITTHSETLPLALRRPINKNLIGAKDIAVYHVEKRNTGTKVRQLRLTKDGYVRGWIPSFAEVELQLLKEWSQTIPKHKSD